MTPDSPNSEPEQTCFLCGTALHDANRTQEDVFPKWLIHRFGVQHHYVVLLNESQIPYGKIRVPACRACNNEDLGSVETRVGKAVARGFEAVRALPRDELFLWGTKILYGLLSLSARLPADQKNPAAGAIVSEDGLAAFEMVRRLLEGFRKRLAFVGAPAYSLWVFRMQTAGSVKDNFDFRDEPWAPALVVRLGEAALVLALDGGLMEAALAHVAATIADNALHPLQLAEFSARVTYGLASRTRLPTVTLLASGDALSVRAQAATDLPALDFERYAALLAAYTRLPVDVLHVPPQVRTFLFDAGGSFTPISLTDEFNRAFLADRPIGSNWSPR